MDVGFLGPKYPNGDSVRSASHALIERLAALPGVTSVGATSNFPLRNTLESSLIMQFHGGTVDPAHPMGTRQRVASEGFFRAAGTRLLQGRDFGLDDRVGTTPVAIVNQTFVNRYGFGNNQTLDGLDILEPRLGISWLPMKDLNVRAGGGLYSGGTPGVWMSNNYTNDGVRTFSSRFTTPAQIQGFDGRNIPQPLLDAIKNGRNNGNVDSLDPDFKLPSVWKVGAGADYSLDIPNTGDYGAPPDVDYREAGDRGKRGRDRRGGRRKDDDVPDW
jgi:hypothetical protein